MISVLLPVYKGDNPRHFDLAIESIYNQTFKNFELVLVVDGPLKDSHYKILEKWEGLFKERMKVVYLKENRGLANALNEGLKRCSFGLVARMDSDDFSLPERLEVQYNFMKEHPEVDVVGSYIGEFFDDVNNVSLVREVPIDHQDIIKIMWLRSPFNHVSVMFKKEVVAKVGNYDPLFGDDDFLWAKMAVAGSKFHNIPQCLVKVRVGADMYKRRGGIKLFFQDFRVKRYLFAQGRMNLFQLASVALIFFAVRLMPNSLRKILYSIIRKKPKIK